MSYDRTGGERLKSSDVVDKGRSFEVESDLDTNAVKKDGWFVDKDFQVHDFSRDISAKDGESSGAAKRKSAGLAGRALRPTASAPRKRSKDSWRWRGLSQAMRSPQRWAPMRRKSISSRPSVSSGLAAQRAEEDQGRDACDDLGCWFRSPRRQDGR